MPGLDAIIDRRAPTALERLICSPLSSVAEYLYSVHKKNLQSSSHVRAITTSDTDFATSSKLDTNSVRIACISDTHNRKPTVPGADILIHAGDLTQSGTVSEMQNMITWLKSLPHRHKVVIAGNHDSCLATEDQNIIEWGDITYLKNSSTVLRIAGFDNVIKVYGSPWTPRNGSGAFQYPREQGRKFWQGEIPDDADIVVTHGPPKYHLDLDSAIGCQGLLEEVWRAKPTLHIFGHVHAGYGMEMVKWDNVQTIYEKIRGGKGCFIVYKTFLVVVLIVYVILGFLESLRNRNWWQKNMKGVKETTFINAAIMKGLRDEDENQPIMVEFGSVHNP